MKIKLYLDWWPGMETHKPFSPYVTPCPGVKSAGTIRLSFDLEIPEDLIGMTHKVDRELPEVVAVEDDG